MKAIGMAVLDLIAFHGSNMTLYLTGWLILASFGFGILGGLAREDERRPRLWMTFWFVAAGLCFVGGLVYGWFHPA
jgi:hypothetical protein